MKTLSEYINEELRDEQDNLQFKVDTWLRNRPEEQELWDAACRLWDIRHQLDDNAIMNYINGTNVKEFINFIKDGTPDPDADDYETVKNIIMNLS